MTVKKRKIHYQVTLGFLPLVEMTPITRDEEVRLVEAREGKDGAAKPPHPCPLSPPPIALFETKTTVISTAGRNPRKH